MKKVLVSIALMIGIAAGASYAWAGGPDGNNGGGKDGGNNTENTENGEGGQSSNEGNQGNNNNNNGGKRTMSQRERFEFMILVGGTSPRPRSVGSVNMTVVGPQIVVECSGIGNATLEVWESCGFCIESIETNTDVNPIVYLTYPEDAGNYVLRVTGEDYYTEWEFEVRDNEGYIWQAIQL